MISITTVAVLKCPHLVSSCFTVPAIWFIFSSRRTMTSLFCLEPASALWRTSAMINVIMRDKKNRNRAALCSVYLFNTTLTYHRWFKATSSQEHVSWGLLKVNFSTRIVILLTNQSGSPICHWFNMLNQLKKSCQQDSKHCQLGQKLLNNVCVSPYPGT